MSSRRNSQRRIVTEKKPSYKEIAGDEDDADDIQEKLSQYFADEHSSGSDFETKIKSKKPEVSESEDNSSSEMESDQIEEAEEEERVGRKKKGGKKMPKKCPLKTKKAKVPSEVPTAKLTPAAKLAKMRRERLVKNSTLNLAASKSSPVEYLANSFGQFRSNGGQKSELNLSESSSDDEDKEMKTEKPKPEVLAKRDVIEKKKNVVETKVESSSEDDGEMASQLVNLVTSYSQATERMKQGASHHGAFKTENPDITASLSDSDSDAGQVKLKPVKAAEQVKPEEIKTEEPDEEEEMASQLENLAKAHSQIQNLPKKSEKPKSNKKTSGGKKPSKKSKTDDHSSIKNLLAMAEGLESQSEESDDEDEDSQAIPGTGIEISLDVPGHIKKKKKGFDVEAFLKREMARVQREVQLSIHQSHVVCLVAHLRHISCYLSSFPRASHPSAAVTLGVALSIVPPIHATVPEKLNLVTLSAFVSWFRESFPIASGSKQLMSHSEQQFPHPLDVWMQRCFEHYFCQSRDHLLLAFIAATRSIGWQTRIVLNFETASMKPPKIPGNDSNSNEGEDSESNKEEKSKKDSKSKTECEKDQKGNNKKEKDRKPTSDADKRKEKEKKTNDKSSNKRKSSETREQQNKRTKREEEKSEKSRERKDGKDRSRSENREGKKSELKRSSKSVDGSRKKDSGSEVSPTKRVKTDESKDRATKRRSSSSKNKPIRDFSDSEDDFLAKKSLKDDKRRIGSSSKSTSSSKSLVVDIAKSVKKSQKNDLSARAIREALKRKSGMSRDREISASESDSESAVKPGPSSKAFKPSSTSKKAVSKTETLSKRKSTSKTKKDDSDFEPEPTPKRSGQNKSRKKSRSDSESDFEAKPKRRTKNSLSDDLPQKKITKAPAKVPAKTIQYWAEVLTPTHGWVTVDIIHGRVNCVSEMENLCKKPILYIIAVNNDGTVKDLTKKYVSPSTYLTQTRKLRVSQEWLDKVMDPFKPKLTPEEKLENEKIEKHLMTAPMPSTVSAFKSHPLFVLKRHLLKFEAIYPENAPTLGFIRGEAVYARECVHTLHCRVTWLKDGRVVRIGEEPYKVVKARPKWDRMNGTVVKDQPLEVFGRWQTEIYVPPPAVDGKVPRNEYGNVELFKPWMLPKGTVHIPIVGLNRVAKKLDIDCAAAMVGWEFSGGGCHPVFDGFVVCEELSETLMDAWNKDQEEKLKKDAEKKEKRALDNWKKLIKGMLMHQKIRKKYLGHKK